MEWSEESAEESVALKREQTPQAKCFLFLSICLAWLKLKKINGKHGKQCCRSKNCIKSSVSFFNPK